MNISYGCVSFAHVLSCTSAQDFVPTEYVCRKTFTQHLAKTKIACSVSVLIGQHEKTLLANILIGKDKFIILHQVQNKFNVPTQHFRTKKAITFDRKLLHSTRDTCCTLYY